jgi:hypothetical protein
MANSPYHGGGMSFTPQQFCVLFNSICTGANVHEQDLSVAATCETAYGGWTTTQTVCRTNHLCNANQSTANANTHCGHTQSYAGNTVCP